MRIDDKSKAFMLKAEQSADLVLNRMAIDIERLSKMQVPKDKGRLQSSGRHKRTGKLKYEVSYNTVYARFQHEGGDGRRTVKNYTTPGTKKEFLRDPGQTVVGRAMSYIKAEMGRIKV